MLLLRRLPVTASRALLALCLSALVLVGIGAAAHARTPKKKPPARAAKPPIAYYFSDYQKAPTRQGAIAKCRAMQKKQLAAHPELRPHHDPKLCESTVVSVRGPYKRKKARGEYDDASIYVYKGSDGGWYDKKGEAPCFAAGTSIATPEGNKPIENMKVGDVVFAYDVAAKRVVPSTVERTKRRPDKLVGTLRFSDGTSVDVTANHPFFSASAQAWVEAGHLAEGDRVLALRGHEVEEMRLAEKTKFRRVTEVYDLTITKHHDYFAAGVLVHNY